MLIIIAGVCLLGVSLAQTGLLAAASIAKWKLAKGAASGGLDVKQVVDLREKDDHARRMLYVAIVFVFGGFATAAIALSVLPFNGGISDPGMIIFFVVAVAILAAEVVWIIVMWVWLSHALIKLGEVKQINENAAKMRAEAAAEAEKEAKVAQEIADLEASYRL